MFSIDPHIQYCAYIVTFGNSLETKTSSLTLNLWNCVASIRSFQYSLLPNNISMTETIVERVKGRLHDQTFETISLS